MYEYVCLPQMIMLTLYFLCNCVEEEITNEKKGYQILNVPHLTKLENLQEDVISGFNCNKYFNITNILPCGPG